MREGVSDLVVVRVGGLGELGECETWGSALLVIDSDLFLLIRELGGGARAWWTSGSSCWSLTNIK